MAHIEYSVSSLGSPHNLWNRISDNQMTEELMHRDREHTYVQLKEWLLYLLPDEQKTTTPLDGLGLIRRDRPVLDESCIYQPVIELIVQGSRQSLIGSERLEYGKGQLMVAGVDIPCIINEVMAKPCEPFLGLSLPLNLSLITQLVVELELKTPTNSSSHKGICITNSTQEIADAFLRLLRLLGSPQHISTLAPMIIREIHYYLLTGPLNQYLRDLATEGTHSQRITQAVTRLRQQFLEPLAIEDLANHAHMSLSTFHRHFRKVTSYSPLQFQKRLRLYEAQRLMLVENLDATSAAFRINYESTSQFNREYKREFGLPPQRDIDRMRTAGMILE